MARGVSPHPATHRRPPMLDRRKRMAAPDRAGPRCASESLPPALHQRRPRCRRVPHLPRWHRRIGQRRTTQSRRRASRIRQRAGSAHRSASASRTRRRSQEPAIAPALTGRTNDPRASDARQSQIPGRKHTHFFQEANRRHQRAPRCRAWPEGGIVPNSGPSPELARAICLQTCGDLRARSAAPDLRPLTACA